jgi:hypothetical protein
MDVSQFYSASLLLLGLLLELLIYLSSKVQEEDKTIKEKNKMFSHIPSFSLFAMSGLILLINSFINIINFRLVWIVSMSNFGESYIINFTSMVISSEFYIFIDLLFILLIFYMMFRFQTRFKYKKFPYNQDGFYLDGSNRTDFFLIGFVYPQIYIIYALGFCIAGISVLLIIFSFIPCGLISYIYRKHKKIPSFVSS